MVDEHVDALLRRFPGLFIAEVSPGTGESLTALPDKRIAVLVFERFIRRILLRGLDISFIRKIEPVVKDDIRLKGADHLDQLFGFPFVASFAVFRIAVF